MTEPRKISLLDKIKILNDLGAQVALEGAVEEARRNGWRVCIAVVDAMGNLLAFRRMDGAAVATILGAQEKARTAAQTQRATDNFQAIIDTGKPSYLGIHWITALEGGVPVIIDGAVVGAVGASGAEAHQDAQIARAGIDAVASSVELRAGLS
jgi:glc operon protein GlcG